MRQRLAGFVAGEPIVLARALERREPMIAAPKNLEQTPLPMFTRGSEAWNELFGPAHGLPAPTRSTAMMSTAIYACVNLLAGAIMALPVNIYRVTIASGERDRLFADDLAWVLNEEMAPRWPASAGWEYLACSLLFEGDAFARIVRGRASQPVGLMPIHPDRVTVGLTADGMRLAYLVEPEVFNGQTVGKPVVLDQDDMLHIPGFGFDGRRGLPPLRYALRKAGGVALATQDYAERFFANSARPDYALRTDQQLAPTKVKELKDQIDEHHQGAHNAHRPMLLHSGLDIKTWSMNASDMQLLAQRQFQVEEICRVYGVPPFMIGHNEKTTSWGSGVESMGKAFVRYALRQHLHKFEVEINRKLFRTAARVAEFDTSDLERADTQTLMNALRVAVGRAGEPGIMRVNEARAVLRLNRDPGGDTLGVNPGPSTPAEPLPTKEEAKPS
jgi:HK97 family phage portal protein